MPAPRAYRTRHRQRRSVDTRERIMEAVRALLAEGTFHDSTVEQVADRAGIARATLYQHFGSRLELVDAICDSLAVNPALLELRQTIELPDAEAALAETIANSVRFWSSEDPILSQLYGVVAIDPAARDLVDRQRADRRGVLERLARNLLASSTPRPGLGEGDVLARLLLLTSYESFCELRAAGLSDAELTDALQQSARQLLLA